MWMKYFVTLAISVTSNESIEYLEGWNYINLHCRDNDNKPVDWWYIYKPPVDIVPFIELGRNFTYITPDSEGRWHMSHKYITANSMLQNTLSPAYRPTYADYLAVLAYEGRLDEKHPEQSSSMGVILADEKGGVWIGHTVPGLLNFNIDRPSFPEEESPNGHLILCLSLDLITLNAITESIHMISPRFIRVQYPPLMRPYLPAFRNIKREQQLNGKISTPLTLNFVTQNKSLRGTVMIRKPGDKNCLYKSFAKKNKLVLDVYGHKGHSKPLCQNDYSVRTIESISIKDTDFVYYVRNGKDRTEFAVSTAAHWQRAGGGGKGQYWTCTSNIDHSSAGIMLCVQDYNVWFSFADLKIKEPEC